MDVLNPESVSAAHEAVKSDYPVMSADWKIDVLKEQVLTSVRRIDEYRGILHSRRHLAASPCSRESPISVKHVSPCCVPKRWTNFSPFWNVPARR